MKRKQTPRTDFIGSIILNLMCVVLLLYGIRMGLDDTVVVLLAVLTGGVIFKTLNTVIRFRRLTGNWPNLRYEDLVGDKR